MVYHSILDALGNTPLIRLNRLVDSNLADVIVKFEALNVGGSIKTRTAYNMVLQAQERGEITKDTLIVEPTSGNQGVGLSLVGAVLGYQVRIIMPDSVSVERRKLCEMYGAEVVLVHDEGDIGECINQCLRLAHNMAQENPRVFIPQQFCNPDNPAVHREQTAQEILRDVNRPIDGLCLGVGTGGTITGIGTALKEHFPNMTIWAVEPEHAAILSGGSIGTHLQMGIGDGLIPDNLDRNVYDRVAVVSDDEALETAQRLAREEGLLCGISSGSNVAAALRMARELGPGKTVLTVLPDTGERYFSTPLFPG